MPSACCSTSERELEAGAAPEVSEGEDFSSLRMSSIRIMGLCTTISEPTTNTTAPAINMSTPLRSTRLSRKASTFASRASVSF